jgi:hypothetical protein
LTLRGYYALQTQRGHLETWLPAIPLDADLSNASDADLGSIGELFGILDGPGIPDVRGTILAKILHRKRPAFIPLYDENIRRCYQDGSAAPITPVPDRSWGDFFTLLASEMRRDLH